MLQGALPQAVVEAQQAASRIFHNRAVGLFKWQQAELVDTGGELRIPVALKVTWMVLKTTRVPRYDKYEVVALVYREDDGTNETCWVVIGDGNPSLVLLESSMDMLYFDGSRWSPISPPEWVEEHASAYA